MTGRRFTVEFDQAVDNIGIGHKFRSKNRRIELVRERDWLPPRRIAAGRKGDGNFVSRHYDGSVPYWRHAEQTDEILADGVGEFAACIEAQDLTLDMKTFSVRGFVLVASTLAHTACSRRPSQLPEPPPNATLSITTVPSPFKEHPTYTVAILDNNQIWVAVAGHEPQTAPISKVQARKILDLSQSIADGSQCSPTVTDQSQSYGLIQHDKGETHFTFNHGCCWTTAMTEPTFLLLELASGAGFALPTARANYEKMCCIGDKDPLVCP